MSYVLVDLGSSQLKWQCRDQQGRFLLRGEWPWTHPAASLDACPWPQLPHGPAAAVVVSAVGSVERRALLKTALERRYPGVPVQMVRPQRAGPLGLKLNYAEQQLGADRYCALLGVLAHERKPAVVVDAGTAVTIDLLTASGQHCGGYILPGLRLGLQPLIGLLPQPLRDQVAADLERALVQDEAQGPGQTTLDAMVRGWTGGLVAAIEHLATGHACAPVFAQSGAEHHAGRAWWHYQQERCQQAIKHGVGRDGATLTHARDGLPIWLTGGDALWLASAINLPFRIERDLVFEGLWQVVVHQQGLSPRRVDEP